ncbi:MAG: YggT family protein [Anaerolineae bacterium]|nr:YggT family protein [Anaerolineae bacterium]
MVLLARVLISWVNVDPYNPIVQLLYQVTEPVLEPLRRVLPQTPGVDFSPLVAMLAIELLTMIVMRTIA